MNLDHKVPRMDKIDVGHNGIFTGGCSCTFLLNQFIFQNVVQAKIFGFEVWIGMT